MKKTKLYFNVFNQIAIYICEDTKTYKVIRGALKTHALFNYKVGLPRLKEVYRYVKSNYTLA